jgi:hypothetical protein
MEAPQDLESRSMAPVGSICKNDYRIGNNRRPARPTARALFSGRPIFHNGKFIEQDRLFQEPDTSASRRRSIRPARVLTKPTKAGY